MKKVLFAVVLFALLASPALAGGGALSALMLRPGDLPGFVLTKIDIRESLFVLRLDAAGGGYIRSVSELGAYGDPRELLKAAVEAGLKAPGWKRATGSWCQEVGDETVCLEGTNGVLTGVAVATRYDSYLLVVIVAGSSPAREQQLALVLAKLLVGRLKQSLAPAMPVPLLRV